jgi:hypothetical protein
MEEWKYVRKQNKKYMVSNHGNVKTAKTGLLKQQTHLRGGYKSVMFGKNIFKIHQLVAREFVANDDPKNKTVVDHLDGNKLNNRADNLEWITPKENTRRGYITGKNKVTKRSVCQYDLNDGFIKEFESLKDAKIKTGIDDGSIANCCKGKVNTAGGYKWRFAKDNPNEFNVDEIDMAEFIPVNGFHNHVISGDGRIISVRFKKIMKMQKNSDGYYTVSLAYNNTKKTFLVHRLVAEHFLKKPAGKDYVNHIDSDRTNYHMDNLEWCTHSENMIHARKMKKDKNKTIKIENQKHRTPKSTLKDVDGPGEKSGVVNSKKTRIVKKKSN